MDLIFTNAERVDKGVLSTHSFDLSYGADENDFELTIGANEQTLETDACVYIEGTEYGGIVGGIKATTYGETVTYKGRTWHGILNRKIILPLREDDHTEGKNLLDVFGRTEKDGGALAQATLRNLETDGYYVGFTSNNYFYRKYIESFSFDDPNVQIKAASSGYGIGFPVILEPGVEYVLSWVCNPSWAGQVAVMQYDPTGAFVESVTTPVGTNTIVFTPSKSMVVILLRPTDSSTAVTYTNIQLEKGSTPTAYEPYGATDGCVIKAKDSAGDSLVDKYLIISGDANDCIRYILKRLGLSGLFVAAENPSGVYISGYKFHRFCKGYDGLADMLADNGAKLKIKWKDRAVILSAEPIVDYTDCPVDGDVATLTVEQNKDKVNHLICLGKGDLAEREVVHLYIDQFGKIGDVQYYTGLAEIVDTYENTNSEDLRSDGIKHFTEIRNNDTAEISLSEASTVAYDIGDLVGATEYKSGVSVAATVTQKIVKIFNGVVSTEYKTSG